MSTPFRRTPLAILLLFSLTIRLVWTILQPSTPAAINRLPDQREYLSLGENLLHQHSLSFYDVRFGQTVFAYRTPGYPWLVALMGASPPAIRIAQAVIDSSTVLAIFLLALNLSGKNTVAFIAGWLVALNPFLIYFCGLVLSETLFTSLLSWGILLLALRRDIFGGLLFLLAVLVRPSAILLGPCLVLSPRRIVTVLGVVIIGLLPWAMRNEHILDHWIWTTTNAGVTVYDGFNPDATGASDQRFLSKMPGLRSINEVERSQYLRRLAGNWMNTHVPQLPALTFKKIGRTWSPVPLSEEFGRPIYRWISALYAVPFDVLILAGLFSTGLNRWAKRMLMIPAIYFTIIHAMSVGSLRYRVPVEPALAVVGGAGASLICRRKPVVQ